MEIHVVMTLPTGTRKCLGANTGRAFAHAAQTFSVIGSIELDGYRVESKSWNEGRISQHWCPVEDCRGTASDIFEADSLDAAIEANAVGIPHTDDPDDDTPQHVEACMDMNCGGCNE